MLSLIALCSLPVFTAPFLLSFFRSRKESILAKRLPKLRPTLRVWAVFVAVLGVDYAINLPFSRLYPGETVRIFACDTTLLVLSFGHMIFLETRPRDLWALGFSVGLVGIAAHPGVAVR